MAVQRQRIMQLPSRWATMSLPIRGAKPLHMQITRIFRNANSRAVRIPADLAYERSDIEQERVGSELRIRPARRALTGVLAKFARFSPDFMADRREPHEQAERESYSCRATCRTPTCALS